MTTSLAAPGETSNPATARWWDQPFRMFQTNLREFDVTLDVETVLDFLEGFGADTWLVNAGGIMSFFPTALEFQTRNPGLVERSDGDLLGTAVREAHERGVRLIARMDFSKVTERIAIAHPEWCFRSPTGELQRYSGMISVCPSGAYYRDRTLDILDEVLDNYDVDGFFFNWFGFNEVDYGRVYWGVCHCESCLHAYTAETGRTELPVDRESPDYGVWQRFAAGQVDAVTTRIRDHIAARRPDVALILGKKADIVFHEANNAVGRPFWPLATEQSVSAIKSARPDAPVLVNSVSFLDMPYRLASEEPGLFSQYLIQTIARGANPSTYIMGTPGDIPYLNLPPAAEITRFHRRHDSVYRGLRSASSVCLVRPDPIGLTAPEREAARTEFQGISLALTERHVPYDVVDESDLPALGLTRFAVVILPEGSSLAPAAAASIQTWVHEGGHLVATGGAAVGNDGVAQLSASPAVRVVNRMFGDLDLRSRYIVRGYEPTPRSSGIQEPAVPIHGALYEYEWSGSASLKDLELEAATFGPPEKAWGNAPNGRPGFGQGRHGVGTITVVPWTLGRVYRELGITVARDYLIDRVLTATGWQPDLEWHLPAEVAVFAGRSAEGLVLHLDNLSGVRQASVGAHIPVTGGELILNRRITRARALIAGTDLTISTGDDSSHITLPTIEQFEVVVIPEA